MDPNDLKLDFNKFMQKAGEYINSLQLDDTEGILKAVLLITGRLIKEHQSKPVTNNELYLMWSIIGMIAGSAYQQGAKLKELEAKPRECK
jgi:hypothetical protein